MIIGFWMNGVWVVGEVVRRVVNVKGGKFYGVRVRGEREEVVVMGWECWRLVGKKWLKVVV